MAEESKSRPYRKVARAQSEERTREALLGAASDEFFADRWPQASLQGLAAKAGVTKQTLLRHFGSKDGLLLQMLMRYGSQIMDQRWSAPVGDIAGAVENLLDHYETWGERSRRVGAWQSESGFLSKLSQMARQLHYDWVEHAFAPWLEPLGEPARARRRAALIVICDLQSWWLLSHDLGFPRSEIQTILVDMLERLLEREPA